MERTTLAASSDWQQTHLRLSVIAIKHTSDTPDRHYGQRDKKHVLHSERQRCEIKGVSSYG
jgi:hypothetical protein